MDLTCAAPDMSSEGFCGSHDVKCIKRQGQEGRTSNEGPGGIDFCGDNPAKSQPSTNYHLALPRLSGVVLVMSCRSRSTPRAATWPTR